jgi:hypothetical protein
MIDDDVLKAVCALVDAVLAEHCLPVGTEGMWNEQHTIDCTLEVLRKISAAPGLFALHEWADKRLLAHEGDVATDEVMEAVGRLEELMRRK